jgi:hypothetical protein
MYSGNQNGMRCEANMKLDIFHPSLPAALTCSLYRNYELPGSALYRTHELRLSALSSRTIGAHFSVRQLKCQVFQKERYNFESLYKFIHRTCTVF